MRKFFQNKQSLSPICRLILFCLLAGFIFLTCVALQAGSVTNTLSNFLHEPTLIALNLFPILIVLGVLTLLFGNVFWAGSLTALVFHLLSLVNLIKIECRKDPLVPPDFSLLNEAMTATGEYQLDLHLPILGAILLFSLLLFLAGFKWKGRIKRVSIRVTVCILLIALFLGAMAEIYPSADLYRDMVASVEGLSSSNVPAVFDEIGFLYCFLHNYNLYETQTPEGYDQARAEAWSKEQLAPLVEPCPADVIMVQCEAFSDVFDLPAFAYSVDQNPLALYHRIADSEQAISGHIVVSNCGAGTANTEFDVLTGIGTKWLNENSTSAFRLVHRNLRSIGRLFSAQGYKLWFMHPGQRWFYNRESVYNYLGFSDQCFLDKIEGVYPKKGYYISDEGFGTCLRDRYEAYKQSSDSPLFAFTVTIQNHQSYSWKKYPDRPPVAPMHTAVSPEAQEALSVYAEGVRDSSLLLFSLTEYFDRKPDPVVLVFWGDHLPAMGKNFSVYHEIGMSVGDESNPTAALETYSTPFVIWVNRAFCERYDFTARKSSLEFRNGSSISDVYLGELLYELTGLAGNEAYWDYLAQARRVLPVICGEYFVLPDGTITSSLNAEQQAVLDKLRQWAYYRFAAERVEQ